LTPPLTLTDIFADEWLWAALEHRKLLAPKPRAPRTKKPDQRRRRTKKGAARKASPEVLPDTDAATPTTSPTITRSPSERTDYSPHRGASPPTPPAGTPLELYEDSDSELLAFNPAEHSREVSRRRRHGLPLSLADPDIDFDVRFFLVSRTHISE
jgi:hypothetical protein